MKSKLLAFAILACGLMALTGCKNSDGKKSDEKEKTEQSAAEQESVVLNAGEDEITAEKDGKPFTGEVWSEDGKSFVMNFKDGEPVNSVTYHRNGKEAIVASSDASNPEPKYYDEEGNEIDVDVFMEKYEAYVEEVGPQMESVFAKIAK